ncbi:XdhC family protein [Nocardioides caricicola]|uniref:XdhC family protein n=1 Tax=Nocardioides caricicola TaxID=634770 RepID=A0ABW0MVM8_9ACTN
MRDVLPELMQWWRAGETVGVGTVVATFQSAPRPAGASMLVGPGGTAVGSVSGGCVEGAVYDLAESVVESGVPVLERYGVSDDDAFAVGLTCGGILDVYVEKVDRETFPELGEIADDIEAGRPVALATVIEHPDPSWLGRRLVVRPEPIVPHVSAASTGVSATKTLGTIGSARADDAVHDDALGLLASGSNATLTYGPDGERRGEGMRVFVWAFAPKPRMLVFGAIDFAAAVARVGSFLGYHVTVCDARPVFATTSRFPEADEVVVDWPHRYLAAEAEAGRVDGRTVITVLTHDPKFDVPLLEVALRLPEVAYVGAMGSRRTHDDRLARLREAGVDDKEIERLSSPIGLDLGARTPEETAISIAAEIIAGRWGGTGERLGTLPGRIHKDLT